MKSCCVATPMAGVWRYDGTHVSEPRDISMGWGTLFRSMRKLGESRGNPAIRLESLTRVHTALHKPLCAHLVPAGDRASSGRPEKSMIRSTTHEWGFVAKLLHWLGAALILVLLIHGWWMPHLVARPDRVIPQPWMSRTR